LQRPRNDTTPCWTHQHWPHNLNQTVSGKAGAVQSKNEQSVKQLAHQVDLSQSALSQHLAKMREAGVVETRRHGLVVYYRLIMPELIGLLKEVVLFVKLNSKKA
ncbi:ArsR/SmtB family transcription factor, partial [Agrobacterium sp. 22-209-1]